MNRYFGSGALMLGAALCLPVLAHAAGFSLLEQTGSGIGDAYAGAGASGDDASVMFFNPAGLSLLQAPQVSIAAHAIDIQTQFHDKGSTLPLAGLGALPAGSTRDDAGDIIPLGNAYVAWPLNDRLALGFAVNTPFGLKTEYDDPWIGRFQGIKSELTTINANPALSYKLNDNISLGFGADYQHAHAELTNAVVLGPATEGRARLDVSDDTWGWNAGALFLLPGEIRIGVSYRSQMTYSLTGDTNVSTITGLPIAAVSGPTKVGITFPSSAEFSFGYPVADALELRGDVSWMDWSKVGTVLATSSTSGLPRDVLQFGFKDATRIALGLQYKRNEQWSFRAGTAWDQSPVTDAVRTVRLPDNDRWWASVGARWRATQNLTLDAAYAHLFIRDTRIALTRAQTGAPIPAAFASTVIGDYDNSVNIVSLQATWAFR
jgi:long-chain fatty acid transport protein